MNAIVVLDLLPGSMDVNGDRGNVLAVVQRLAWAGLRSSVVTGDDAGRWAAAPDLVHVGGASAAGQAAALELVGDRRHRLQEWVADGVPVLGVAGGFHLLLDRLLLPGLQRPVRGLGLLPGSSGPARRTSGFAVASTSDGLVHGYCNLGQAALLGEDVRPWARVVSGCGNEHGGLDEGAVRGSVIGTNLHGPLLPRNPWIADALIRTITERRGLDYRPNERHRAVDAIADRANTVLRARAASRRSATYATAGRG